MLSGQYTQLDIVSWNWVSIQEALQDILFGRAFDSMKNMNSSKSRRR
jgi:hypothetical protein